jgi:hypothetical protein
VHGLDARAGSEKHVCGDLVGRDVRDGHHA